MTFVGDTQIEAVVVSWGSTDLNPERAAYDVGAAQLQGAAARLINLQREAFRGIDAAALLKRPRIKDSRSYF
jgi:hypothetical protein